MRMPAIVVQRGAFRVEDGTAPRSIAGPGSLIGELALIVPMKRPSTAIALERSSVIRVARSLFQRVLESDPAAARRLRDEFAARTSQIASDILMAGAKLSYVESSSCPMRPARSGSLPYETRSRWLRRAQITPPAPPSPAHGPTAAPSCGRRG